MTKKQKKGKRVKRKGRNGFVKTTQGGKTPWVAFQSELDDLEYETIWDSAGKYWWDGEKLDFRRKNLKKKGGEKNGK